MWQNKKNKKRMQQKERLWKKDKDSLQRIIERQKAITFVFPRSPRTQDLFFKL